MPAGDGGCHAAKGKEREHSGMKEHSFEMRTLPVPDALGEEHADLTDVIRAERRCRRDAVRLTEGVVLHGADEVDSDLRDLKRRRIGDKSQTNDDRHLDEDQERVPSDEPEFLD